MRHGVTWAHCPAESPSGDRKHVSLRPGAAQCFVVVYLTFETPQICANILWTDLSGLRPGSSVGLFGCWWDGQLDPPLTVLAAGRGDFLP
jgi:hypothetical protein